MNDPAALLPSFFIGGFECSTHRLRSGRRLDLIAATRHDELAEQDYRRLTSVGIRTARDGVRWMLTEPSPGRYDFSSVRPMIEASLRAGVVVIWDLLHFGWPDHVDVFDPAWPRRFADYAAAFGRVLERDGVDLPWIAPVNEISFLAFAGGEAGFFNPFAHERGGALKRMLVRASIAAGQAIRAIEPRARLVHCDPVIQVEALPHRPDDVKRARDHERAQFEAWDLIAGRLEPELGGSPECLDIIGINYYVHNHWFYPGGPGLLLPPSHPKRRPLHQMLMAVAARYGRPMFIAETGIEDEARAPWLAHVGHECRRAMRRGVDLQGICLYPIVNHPGWDDDRHCHNGLWDYPDERGHREIYQPLAGELGRQQRAFERLRAGESEALEPPDPAILDPIAEDVADVTERTRVAEPDLAS